MSPLTLLTIRKGPFPKVFPGLIAMSLILYPLLALGEGDPCLESGIYIANQTMLNLWYTLNGGDCTIWNHHHILNIKPGDELVIFRDLICETEYCLNSPTYKGYKLLDANQNCRVRILPQCTLADM